MSRIESAKRLHAGAMLVVPALGTVAALLFGWRNGVGWLELLTFSATYSAAMIGITVGYHRYFAHRAFDTHPLIAAGLAIAGGMAGQGPVMYWVGNHRLHHQHVDAPGDPHSPFFDGDRPLQGWSGFLHAHVGWTWRHPIPNTVTHAKDLLRDPLVRWLNRGYFAWLALGFALPAAFGGLVAGWEGALRGLLWGGFVRACVGYQVALSIGSFAHTFGDRPYAIRGNSANNVWLALPTFGEGWHQNHHAFPTAASFGLTPRQVDVGALFIRALAAVGLAWNVRAPSPQAIARRGVPLLPEVAE